jgi:hypothetical protein
MIPIGSELVAIFLDLWFSTIKIVLIGGKFDFENHLLSFLEGENEQSGVKSYLSCLSGNRSEESG